MNARNTTVLSAGLLAVTALTGSSFAHNSYLTAWVAAYPTSTLPARVAVAAGSSCYICHQPPNTSAVGTCYKSDLVARLAAGRTIAQAIADVGAMDSDGDGTSSRDEILMPRADAPGQIGYHPGLIGATGTDPCAANPAAAVTHTLETPPPPTPPCGSADFNGDGDTGTDADIEAFFACLAGNCCATCGTTDFNGDGDTGTDADIEAFFRVLGGGTC